MKATIAKAKENTWTPNCSNFYSPSGEIIYKLDDGTFVHIDSFGELLFAENPLESYDIVGEGDFSQYFWQMTQTAKKDYRFEEDANFLRNRSGKPVIIGGCGRSGTTLLLSILCAHSKIFGIGDEAFAFHPNPYRLQSLIGHMNRGGFDYKGVWCEKTPKNCIEFNRIHDLFEGKVKIIHMVRDCRDVITSIHPNYNKRYWVPIERWINDVTVGLSCKYAKIVKYEELVFHPEETLKDICCFIELDYEDNLMEYHKHTSKKEDPAWFDKAQKINTSRIGKWENPKFKDRLAEFESNGIAIELMQRLGYRAI